MEALLIILIFVFVLGYFIGWTGHAKQLFDRLTENPDEMIRLLNEYKKSSEIEVKEDTGSAREVEVEHINNIFYLYAKDNGQFLAQATTLDEALVLIEKRFPNQTFQGIISSEEAKRMGLSKVDNQNI